MMLLTLTIGGVDVSHRTPYEVKVKAGRDDIESQPDATVLTFSMLGHGQEQVGDLCVLTDDYGQVFSGYVTDLKAEQDDGMGWTVSCTATGPLAVLGHLNVGAAGWPRETDSARIARAVEEAGLPHLIDANAAGPDILPHEAGETVNAADAARDAADSGMGVLWEDPTDPLMRLRYLNARQRAWKAYDYTWAELPPLRAWTGYAGITWSAMDSDNVTGVVSTYPGHIEIDPGTANAEVTFEQSVGDWARKITVTWGAEPEGGGDRPVVTTGTQPPEEGWDTILADVADATTFASTMLRRKRYPSWRLTSLLVHSALLPPDVWLSLRGGLVVGLRITVPFPHGSPVGTLWEGYLEGWEHQATEEGHTLALNVSDRQLTEPADRWMDASPTTTWDDLADDLRWVYAVDLP